MLRNSYAKCRAHRSTSFFLIRPTMRPRNTRPRSAFSARPPRAFSLSEAIVIAEHRRKQNLNQRYGDLERYRLLEQGDAALSFYRTAEASTRVAETASENT